MTTKITLPRIDDGPDGPDAGVGAPGRVTRFDVERLACGELTGDARARVEAALKADPALQAFFDDVVASDRAFLIERPPAAFFAQQASKASASSLSSSAASLSWRARLERFVMRWEAGVGVLAAATAIVVVINLGSEDVVVVDGNRTKGGSDVPSVGFFVQDSAAGSNRGDDGSARVGHPGEPLQPGDRIQLAVKDVDKQAMVVVGVDGHGVVSVYAREQLQSTTKGATPGGKPRLLPVSLILDDTLGAERFFVVYGDDVVELERAARVAAARLGALVRQGSARLEDVGALELGADVSQASVHILKVR